MVCHERECMNVCLNISRSNMTVLSGGHLDEMYLKINGRPHYLWRAADQQGVGFGILVQSRLDRQAARRVLGRLLTVMPYTPPGPQHRQAQELRRRHQPEVIRLPLAPTSSVMSPSTIVALPKARSPSLKGECTVQTEVNNVYRWRDGDFEFRAVSPRKHFAPPETPSHLPRGLRSVGRVRFPLSPHERPRVPRPVRH